MIKRIIIITAAVTIFVVLAWFGYVEYVLDFGKIDWIHKDYSEVVTLSIGDNVRIIRPYSTVVQVISDRTVTANTFKEIPPWENNRTYGDKIIKGRTVKLTDDKYAALINIIKNCDFEAMQNEMEAVYAFDGNYTYITVKDSDGFRTVGGHCAEDQNGLFKEIMDCILSLLE